MLHVNKLAAKPQRENISKFPNFHIFKTSIFRYLTDQLVQ